MRKFLASLCCLAYLLACTTTVQAGMLLNSYTIAAPVAATITFQQCLSSGADGSAYNAAAQNTGTAGATRSTIVGVIGTDSAADFTFTAMTLDGNAMTQVVEQSNGAGQSASSAALYIISNPSGTTGAINFTASEAITGATICVWAAYDLVSLTAASTNKDSQTTNPLTLNVTIPTDGIGVGICIENFTDAFTWTGMTERSDAIGENTGASNRHRQSAADTATPGAPLAVTCDSGASGVNGVTAGFR